MHQSTKNWIAIGIFIAGMVGAAFVGAATHWSFGNFAVAIIGMILSS